MRQNDAATLFSLLPQSGSVEGGGGEGGVGGGDGEGDVGGGGGEGGGGDEGGDSLQT